MSLSGTTIRTCKICGIEFRTSIKDDSFYCEDCESKKLRVTLSETQQDSEYERRAMEWIFYNGKLTGAEGKDLIKYIFNQ